MLHPPAFSRFSSRQPCLQPSTLTCPANPPSLREAPASRKDQGERFSEQNTGRAGLHPHRTLCPAFFLLSLPSRTPTPPSVSKLSVLIHQNFPSPSLRGGEEG